LTAGIPSHIPTTMPVCPMCWRSDGTHMLGCAVDLYIENRGLRSV
jgi:hypothetical protein